MSATGAPEITVENHLVRFVPMNPVDGQIAIKKLGAKESGDFVIHLLDKPRATILIDKQGRIVIHGTRRVATARAAGWSAHRIEEILSGRRVIRPAYKFVG